MTSDTSPAPELPTILYIAGYSRAGSTMLDMILGAHHDFASTGELVYLTDDAPRADRVCTCGAHYPDCPVYAPWLQQAGPLAEVTRLLRATESREALDALRAGRLPATVTRGYRDHARALFSRIAQAQNARIVIDSSKSAKDAAGRPLALARVAGLKVKVLHLTRDPGATLKSYIDKGSNWVLEGYRKPRPLESWRPIVGWTKANRIATGFAEDFGNDYMHMRYEDFIAAPDRMLARIGAFTGTDLSGIADRIRAGDPFTAGHNVGGNRNRLKPQVISLSAPERAKLSPLRRAALSAVAGPTATKLGYRGRA